MTATQQPTNSRANRSQLAAVDWLALAAVLEGSKPLDALAHLPKPTRVGRRVGGVIVIVVVILNQIGP